MYSARIMKNIEKKSNKTENSMITHKGSLENPKIEKIKTNINNGKEAINQLLNITEP